MFGGGRGRVWGEHQRVEMWLLEKDLELDGMGSRSGSTADQLWEV